VGLQRIAEVFHRLVLAIQPFAEHLGGTGLLLVALLDSSFITLPEVADALIVILTIQHPGLWLYYGLMTTLGSLLGCYVLYYLARKGGEAFLGKFFKPAAIESGKAAFRKFGVLALIVPSIMPPPVPFKIFVLLAGIAGMGPVAFIAAVFTGRAARYVGEAWLAYRYAPQATVYIQNNLPHVLLWLGLGVGAIGLAVVLWRQRRPA